MICIGCQPPERLEDLDQTTTIYRCPEHQALYDEVMRRIRIDFLIANYVYTKARTPPFRITGI